jgi:hypothetical protein
MPIDDETANEAIFSARSAGRSIVAIADEFRLSQDKVRSIVAEMVARTYNGGYLREDIALENHRLKAISLKYYGLATNGEDGDYQAAAIYVKTSERRMGLLGGNSPQAYAVHLSHDAAPEAKTSTQKLMETMDEVFGIGARERLLSNKETLGQDMTLGEVEELEGFRAAREAEQDAAREQARRERADRLAARRGNGGAVE